ncbi:MAG: hypothetical protein IPH72_34545 [Sandaracinaceae bacterium]|nr:hypothetical protein [Sandaracinaceae bacterium]
MTTRVDLRCQCGAVRGVSNDIAPHTGMHIVCMCDDCQAFAHFLEQDDVLDASGQDSHLPGQAAPAEHHHGWRTPALRRVVREGHVALVRGLLSHTIANTMASARAPFAGVITAFIVPEAGASKEAVLGRSSPAS